MKEEEPKKKRGRPKKDGARRVQLKILLTEEEYKRLSEASKLVGRSKSDIVREGIDGAITTTLIRDLPDEDIYDFEEFEVDENDDF